MEVTPDTIQLDVNSRPRTFLDVSSECQEHGLDVVPTYSSLSRPLINRFQCPAMPSPHARIISSEDIN